MEEDKPPFFVFTINEQLLADKPYYEFHMGNTGVPDDVVICILESWLRAVKDHYYENIRAGMKF